MESCVGKTVMAGVMGGGLGAMFGLFMSSVGHSFPAVTYSIGTQLPMQYTDMRWTDAL